MHGHCLTGQACPRQAFEQSRRWVQRLAGASLQLQGRSLRHLASRSWLTPLLDRGLQRLVELAEAQAVSSSNRLQYLVPNLVEAMFTDFPGNSGETLRISIAPEDQPVRRSNR